MTLVLRQAGLTNGDIGKFYRDARFRRDVQRVYQIAHRRGNIIPFRGELAYLMAVDGVQFSGGPSYQRLRGQSIASATGSPIIVGSPQYKSLAEKIIVAHTNRGTLDSGRQKQAERILAGQVLVGMRPRNRRDRSSRYDQAFRIQLSSRIQWFRSKRTPGGFDATINGQAVWLRNGRWANSSFRAGQQVPVQVIAKIGQRPSGQWFFGINLLVPDRHTSGFYHTGQYMGWNEAAGRFENQFVRFAPANLGTNTGFASDSAKAQSVMEEAANKLVALMNSQRPRRTIFRRMNCTTRSFRGRKVTIGSNLAVEYAYSIHCPDGRHDGAVVVQLPLVSKASLVNWTDGRRCLVSCVRPQICVNTYFDRKRGRQKFMRSKTLGLCPILQDMLNARRNASQ